MNTQGMIPAKENANKKISDRYQKKTYAKGATCIYGDTLYRAKADITTAEEWTDAHWEETNMETIRAEMAAEVSSLNASNDWVLLAQNNTTTETTTNVDTSPYRFISFELYFYAGMILQIIVPRNRIGSVRSLSTLIDGDINAKASVDYQGTTSNTIAIKVLVNFNNAISGRVYGIK